MAEQETRTYALSDLAKRRRAELRLSLRALAERCIDPETGVQEIKHSWIERLEKRQGVTPPQLPELRALAAGLSVPLRSLQDAAGEQFLGIRASRLDESGDIRLLADLAAELSDETRANLLAIAETLRRSGGK